MTITKQSPTEPLEASGGDWERAVAVNVGRMTQPYWLDRPCPPWCQTGHRDDDDGMDRVHSSSRDPEIELTLEPRVKVESETYPAHIGAVMSMHYREARPHINLCVSDREEILLELTEARELARLLADPPREWASLTLTMMDPDSVLPSGLGEGSKPVSKSMARVAAFPFTRSPIAAVRQVLDSVTIFCPVQTDPYRDQSLRYLVLSPGEAAELSAMIARLLDQVKLSPRDAALSSALGPAIPVGLCPPWCEIDDHQDHDGGKMRHSTSTTVGLSLYPYEVTSTESGEPVVTLHSAYLIVSRTQLRDHESAILVELPDVNECADPDGHIALPNEALFTFAEAQDMAVALLVMARDTGGSPHFACAPGDPSPCCSGESLRQSTYEVAAFCTECGSLYWSEQ
jgi:hypothetical protein